MTESFQPGQHLSPDQLSAFAENVLPEHERLTALTHLSACADCRQVVFLAQQADPAPIVVPAAETPRRSWFTLPQIFGAATAALACSLIPALIIHLRPNQNPVMQTVTTAKLETAPAIQPQSSVQPASSQVQKAQIASTRSNPIDKGSSTADAPLQPAKVQMAPAPQPIVAMGYGTATGMESKAKTAEPRAQDKQNLTGSAANASVAPVPQKSPAIADGMMAMPAAPQPPAAQLEARARQTYAAPPPATSVDANAMADTIDTARIENLPLNGRSATNLAALTPGAVQPLKLPSKKPAASVLNAAGRTLALDSDGTLFRSNDRGKHWTAVTAQWSGKAVQLSFAPTPARLYLAQPAQNQAQSQISNSNTGAVAAGVPQQQAPIPTAGFELTTATGAVWLSTDGLTWHAR